MVGRAARPGECDLTDDHAPPTRLPQVGAGSGTVTPREQHEATTHREALHAEQQ